MLAEVAHNRSGTERPSSFLGGAALLSLALTILLALLPLSAGPQSSGVEPSLQNPLSRDAAGLLAPVIQNGTVGVRRYGETGQLHAVIIASPALSDETKSQVKEMLTFGIDFQPGSDVLEFQTSTALSRPESDWLKFGPAVLSALVFGLILIGASRTNRSSQIQVRTRPPQSNSNDNILPGSQTTDAAVVQIREWMTEHQRG